MGVRSGSAVAAGAVQRIHEDPRVQRPQFALDDPIVEGVEAISPESLSPFVQLLVSASDACSERKREGVRR